ncbi:MAG TPA: YceI family protein [Rubrivivax sp.]|nr:YceI family protein [Rubrivivax sp.]
MKAGFRVLMLALCAAAVVARADPVVYELDPDHSFVHFEVTHFGTSTLRGRLGPLRGEVMLDRQVARGELSLRIPITTLDTGIGVFTERLLQPDLLDAGMHPEAYFVARQFRFDPADKQALVEVRGEFTLRGTSQPLSLHARRFGCRPHVGTTGEVCGGDFEGTLLRSEFGATLGLPLVADRVRLLVQVQGRRRP